MRCLSCGQDNPPEAGFCANCGATLEVTVEPSSPAAPVRCNSCGQDNPPEAAFCSNCGATLAATVEAPPPRVVTKSFIGRLKWILIGGLAILIMFQIVYSFAFLIKAPPPPPAPYPRPAPGPPPPEVKGEVLLFEDFESGSQNWDLEEGWYLEKIGDNTVLKGRAHTWATLQDKAWGNYDFEAKFKLIKGRIHFNYRRSTSPERSRYFVEVSSGGIYLEKESGGKLYQITQIPLKLDEGWHEIEIMGYGNAVNVYIDDTLRIVCKDDNPLLTGGIAFQTLDDSEFLIDDVKITQTTGPPPPLPLHPPAPAPRPSPLPAPAPPSITFPDENLEAAIRDALGKAPGEEITADDLAELTGVQAIESGITDLSGLEYCTNLTRLQLEKNQISDITLLENLTSLNVLQLDRNQISDITPLENLTSLNGLELGDNQISDITPLENVTSLTRLELWGNQISDITPLASLTNLTVLRLEENEISDITILENLTSLNVLQLDRNQI
ncbi:leucine-rich repeat domain-containing protein, partial [Chloroflexota bacterium]